MKWLPVPVLAAVAAFVLWPSDKKERRPVRERPRDVEQRRPARADAEPDDARADASEAPALQGTIVVRDERDSMHPRETGLFEIRGESSEAWVAVAVKSGRWSTSPLQGPVRIRRIRLGDRLAIPSEKSWAVPERGEVALTCTWALREALDVYDAGTGQPLSEAAVYARQSYGDLDPIDLVVAGPPPLVLPDPPLMPPGSVHEERYYMRAPGYAWKRVDVQHGHGRTHRVELTRAGSVIATLLNLRADVRTRLRLHRPKGTVRVDLGARTTTRVDHIAPGIYLRRVEADRWYDEPHVLASASIELPAGETTTTTLTLGDPPAAGVPFRGTLEVAPGWDGVDVSLSVIRHAGNSSRGGPVNEDGNTWDAGLVPPGRYCIEIGTLLQVPFDVPKRGLTNAHVRLPPPADITLRFVDKQQREVALDSFAWHPQWPEGARGGGLESVRRADGVLRFRAAPGTIYLTIWQSEYELEQPAIQVREGENRIDVVVISPPTLRVKCRLGDAPVSIPKGFGMTIEAIGHDGRPNTWTSSDDYLARQFTKAGRYRIKIKVPDGFEPVPDRAVDVPEGLLELVIELKRTR